MGSEVYEGPGVYSNIEIRSAIRDNHIICHPFIPEHVNTSSIDVTLGHYYYATEKEDDFGGLLNPYDKESVSDYFEGPFEAKPFREYGKLCKKMGKTALVGIPEDHPVIIIGPHERILGHTHEFVGIKPPGTTKMEARSTTGRLGITTCKDAGWGDSGYLNRWTMEIENGNKRDYIVLPAGEPVAQIVFLHTGPVDGEYATDTGNYQSDSSNDLKSIIANWRPEMMLPRSYKGKRSLPVPISDLADGLK